MTRVPEEQPNTFTEFVELVEELQSKPKLPKWYRGCGRADYRLLPTLYRHKTATTINDLSRLENELIARFRQRSIPFHSRALENDWDVLFFMQHYGVPTRLLDWTESPFIGLYFAVMSAPYQTTTRGRLSFPSAAAVWILDPIIWNKHSLNHQSFDGEILTPSDDALKGYKPTTSFSSMNNHPVALYGAHNSPRIVAQRGVFTIFGQNTKAMEEIYDEDDFPDDSLIKVKLNRSALIDIRNSILNHGVTESVVFPDLEGLAKEIRRIYGFEV